MNARILLIIVCSVFFVFQWGAFMLIATEKESEPVAIVCYLSGKATVTMPPDNKLKELQLFERLKAGSEIETKSDSKVILIFFTGTQYEINEQTKATVEQKELKAEKGSIKNLQSIAAMAQIAPIANEENPGKRTAAIRIRSEHRKGLELLKPYPSDGTTVLSNNAILSFKPVEGIKKYKVDVEDEMGNSIFSLETSSTTITISPHILKDGVIYYWRVRSLDQEKPSIHAEAIFGTVSTENVKLRTNLMLQVEKQQDIALLMLLAETDHNLGLKKEACDELKIAISKAPNNPALKQVRSHFECAKDD